MRNRKKPDPHASEIERLLGVLSFHQSVSSRSGGLLYCNCEICAHVMRRLDAIRR